MQTVNDIRTTFLEFFRKNGHEVVSSSPLVPRNDPTLMFTNAGMVQFKNVFTGQEHRDYSRAATSQKCVRAGGKHNDLENVGHTARHHTFFEMLGNFSFGDYFKENAIEFAWNLITKEYGLPKDKLLVTVYHTDDEAHGLWKKIAGLTEDRIIRIPTSDNFWSMGDTGPCGPCSEIFFDHGDHIWGGPPGSAEEDGDRFIEIWNLVFMQYEQMANGDRVDLPKPSIDTGMGLERIAAVLQGKHDNYDIDLMRALVEASADATNTDPDGSHNVSHRVVADHLRSTSFLIADGVLPSNAGRGNVLRRIMRRAMRHLHMVGTQDPTMYKLVPALVSKMGGAFPELVRAQALIEETLKLEEQGFKTMLDRGLKMLDDATDGMDAGATLSGDVAFKLYDTYGFPLDLTADALKERKIGIDEAGFTTAMEEQKAKARSAWSGSGEAATEEVWFDINDRDGATEFLGYETETAEGVVTALIKDGAEVKSASKGDEVAVLANQTTFFGESGGQQGDAGVIKTEHGAIIEITDTQKKLGSLHVHLGKVTEGDVKVGDAAEFRVDHTRRSSLRANHSATHLLHAVLRKHLGDHVTQKGSLVAADRLRFDISHPKAVTAEEAAVIEADVNSLIRENSEVTTRLMTPDEAIELGAMALFGEKYGDEVRVVSMGLPVANEHAYSLELCGGTHVKRTGDIGMFKIVSEGAVSSGVRRIEALTGADAAKYMSARENVLTTVAADLKAVPEDVPARVKALQEERRRLEREVSDLRKKLATAGSGAASGADAFKEVNGVKMALRSLDGIPAKELKGMVDELRDQMGSGIVALVSGDGGKASIVVGLTADLTDKYSAVDLVRIGVEKLGGKGGGGRPDMAQGGGSDPAQADAALAAIEAHIAG
ncbi:MULTISPECIES: alanine--tRNA ligase [Thalassospira]|uniref:Alanine--tRNA ligase n=4 Tax=Thalassospira TaxID=168934 RepID=A0A853KVS6_9PROT|nr:MULTISPECIES: alanine--tRNA ligase [Thalassospira]MBO6820559.1 alanine--tRNA ligase [Thalassospira sp.]NJB76003.1 alanyl-tRNA synthetase [Thalassospira tepidiphila]OAZ07940.1 alanyl-tRNA synthetase [Thalassospira tepidiphila MCCC 1A03514]